MKNKTSVPIDSTLLDIIYEDIEDVLINGSIKSRDKEPVGIIASEKYKMFHKYTCEEVCGQKMPCKNRYCSANPFYYEPKKKKLRSSSKSYSFPYFKKEKKVC